MKINSKYHPIISPEHRGFRASQGLNQKWPARNERTIYHNLTIGLKDEESFTGKEIFLKE